MKREESEALKTLKGNEDIVITPADKGCYNVVMDKPEYIKKIIEHSNDETTYVQKTVDTTFSLRTKLNAYLKNVCDRLLISRPQYLQLFANSATIPLFYALVKIHK